jgi:hypothetical protein
MEGDARQKVEAERSGVEQASAKGKDSTRQNVKVTRGERRSRRCTEWG